MNNLCKDRLITFTIPDDITSGRFFHRNTDWFKWAKNATEVRSDIIHDTNKHIDFESKKIIDSIRVDAPWMIRHKNQSKNADSINLKGVNGNVTTHEKPSGSDTKGGVLGDSGSILDILTAEELETPLIKDHLEVLKRWQKEDSGGKFFGGISHVSKLEMREAHKARKTGLKQDRWFDRLNELKKSYIVTKSENILPFQMTIPRGALQTGNINQDLEIRLKWVIKALPNTTPGNLAYIFIQPIHIKDDQNSNLSQLSGYIYLRQVSNRCLEVRV